METKLTGNIDTTLPKDSVDNLSRYFRALDDLGLKCPSTEASEHFERAEEFRALALAAKAEAVPTVPGLGRQLGRGEVAIRAAEKLLPGVAVMRPQDFTRAKVAMFVEAAKVAKGLARKALHQVGDALLDGPREVAMEALADSRNVDAQMRWDSAQHLANIIRGLGVVPSAEGANNYELTFARPDLVTQWRKENTPPNFGAVAPTVTLRVIGDHPEWGPGVLTAAEVIENAEAMTAS